MKKLDLDKFDKIVEKAWDEDYSQSPLYEDLMYEMATIGSYEDLCVAVNPDSSRGWYGEEYFKVYDNESSRKAEHICRIKFRDLTYTIHSSRDGKKPMKLTKKQLKRLIKFFHRPSKYPGLNNWQYAILMFNLEAFENATYETCLSLTKEKQAQMEECPEKYYLPIDLEMPDYLKL